MTPDDALIRRILRVNHAGEHGAIAIYSAQLAQLGDSRPDLKTWIEDTLAHERAHQAAFGEAMRARRATPCGALAIWTVGGWLLGRVTALLGRHGVMACTAAVERTVHRHLEQQIAFLSGRDPALAAMVRDIQREELGHLAYAEGALRPGSMVSKMLEPLIAFCTGALIALSTQGASLTLSVGLRDA